LPCADVWFLGENDARRGIEHCLVRWASSRGGYPPSLREIGPLGDACLPPGLDADLAYTPAAPDRDGVIRDFRLDTPRTLAGP
jgi:hypothetical protein